MGLGCRAAEPEQHDLAVALRRDVEALRGGERCQPRVLMRPLRINQQPRVGAGGRMLAGGTPLPVHSSRSSYCVPSASFWSVSGCPLRRVTVARPSESEPPAIEIFALPRPSETRWKSGSNGASGGGDDVAPGSVARP